uniref:Uncharacterized protein n=1 Tax=Sparus aurata TaxID=8175 RepID=A0A671X068_SPAAU
QCESSFEWNTNSERNSHLSVKSTSIYSFCRNDSMFKSNRKNTLKNKKTNIETKAPQQVWAMCSCRIAFSWLYIYSSVFLVASSET